MNVTLKTIEIEFSVHESASARIIQAERRIDRSDGRERR